ncbi:hypothetical protein HRG_014923 [Hirsutella rhossiliensis]
MFTECKQTEVAAQPPSTVLKSILIINHVTFQKELETTRSASIRLCRASTRKLYDEPKRKESEVLVQLRTGKSRTNSPTPAHFGLLALPLSPAGHPVGPFRLFPPWEQLHEALIGPTKARTAGAVNSGAPGGYCRDSAFLGCLAQETKALSYLAVNDANVNGILPAFVSSAAEKAALRDKWAPGRACISRRRCVYGALAPEGATSRFSISGFFFSFLLTLGYFSQSCSQFANTLKESPESVRKVNFRYENGVFATHARVTQLQFKQTMACTYSRPRKVSLVDLPYDILDRIYNFVLVEDPRWEKEHKLGCRFKLNSAVKFESPPFLLGETRVSISPPTIQTANSCSCAKRKGLGLLLTNRAIHLDASRIFWSKNIFCFLSGWEFAITVGHKLRPEYCDYLQFISIVSPDEKRFPRHLWMTQGCKIDKAVPGFWDVILRCKGLRLLEIPSLYLRQEGNYFNILAHKLTHLRFLDLTGLKPYYRAGLHWHDYADPGDPDFQRSTAYLKYTRRIEIHTGLNNSIRHASWRAFDHDFRIKVEEATMQQILEPWSRRLASGLSLASDPHQYNGSHQVRLPSGEMVTITLYGLPIIEALRRPVGEPESDFGAIG